jgi:hypothetical protein
VSYHLFALAGSRDAVTVARAAGHEELAGEWARFHAVFRASVMRRLEQLVDAAGGVITPGFEGYTARPVMIRRRGGTEDEPCTGAYGETGGIDWQNFCASFPTDVIAPDHPWITSSLARWRHAYVEGVFPYPYDGQYHWVHNYNTINLSETWLRRGDHAEAVRDLYGLLLHTSATHASAEVVDTAGRRDFSCTPHNWFSAKLVRFIRDMLVYETPDGWLHLLGGLAPAWMAPGSAVAVERAPTELGVLSFRTEMRQHGFDMTVALAARRETAGLALHVPPFLEVTGVTVDGSRIPVGTRPFALPPQGGDVSVTWRPCELPAISFTAVAAAFAEDHRRRVSEWRGRTE